MNAAYVKENLKNNCCHIHSQQPVMDILENGKVRFSTCCILFKQQLHLMVNEADKMYVED